MHIDDDLNGSQNYLKFILIALQFTFLIRTAIFSKELIKLN